MHPELSPEDATSVTINHPNQYFELAQKASKGIPLSSSGGADPPAQRTTGMKRRVVKVPLNDSQMTNQGQSGFEDTTIDDEISKIDSTLLEYSSLDF